MGFYLAQLPIVLTQALMVIPENGLSKDPAIVTNGVWVVRFLEEDVVGESFCKL